MQHRELMAAPARRDMTNIGFEELRTPDDVDQALASDGSLVMVAVNSMCGCSGGVMRPAVARALEAGPQPDRIATVFAGVDMDATEHARQEYFLPHPPSSPAVFLMRDGEVLSMLPREHIQGRQIDDVARDISTAIAKHAAPEPREEAV